jgi:hypothetical protein
MPDPLVAWIAGIGALAALTVLLTVALDIPVWIVAGVVVVGIAAGMAVTGRSR